MVASAVARTGVDPGPLVQTPAGARFACAVAAPDDDPVIRRLLRGHTLPGDIRLSLEREPDAALAATTLGDVHQTLVARDQSNGQIVGVASRSVRNAFVNGSRTRLGYLGQFRIDCGCRRVRTVLADGFEFCRTLHDQGDARLYLTSLVADNDIARRLLIRPASGSAPAFVPADRLTTFAIPVRRRPRAVRVGGIEVRTATASLMDEIAACLQRSLRRFQFAPCWTAADLLSPTITLGLDPEDFVVAIQGCRLIGCLALWDQRAFKQVRVRGYSPSLRRARPFVNLASALLGTPSLPDVGRTLESAYLSHAAVDDDRGDVLSALVAAQRRRAADAGLDYVVTAFAGRHPFHAVIARRVRHRAYESVLYAGCWDDGQEIVRSLDGRVAQPEVAVL